jgi:hypothetical protein
MNTIIVPMPMSARLSLLIWANFFLISLHLLFDAGQIRFGRGVIPFKAGTAYLPEVKEKLALSVYNAGDSITVTDSENR